MKSRRFIYTRNGCRRRLNPPMAVARVAAPSASAGLSTTFSRPPPRGWLRDCRRESPALEGGDELPSSSTFSARRGCRCPPRISLGIRRGTSAPLSGQSDKLGCIRPTPDGPPSGDVGIGSDTGTSESADERRKPRGNDGARRFEERSSGHLAWPVETAPRWGESPTRTRPLHEPKTPNQRGAVRAWESSPFRPRRMSIFSHS